jgi:hypothetical protein
MCEGIFHFSFSHQAILMGLTVGDGIWGIFGIFLRPLPAYFPHTKGRDIY